MSPALRDVLRWLWNGAGSFDDRNKYCRPVQNDERDHRRRYSIEKVIHEELDADHFSLGGCGGWCRFVLVRIAL